MQAIGYAGVEQLASCTAVGRLEHCKLNGAVTDAAEEECAEAIVR